MNKLKIGDVVTLKNGGGYFYEEFNFDHTDLFGVIREVYRDVFQLHLFLKTTGEQVSLSGGTYDVTWAFLAQEIKKVSRGDEKLYKQRIKAQA